MNMIIVFTDGGARGNPGPAGIGVVIKNENGEVLTKFGEVIGETTNNVAEYTAVIRALEWLKHYSEKNEIKNYPISFFLDSLLVVQQLNGVYKVKSAPLQRLKTIIHQLELFFPTVTYAHIPREKNKEADLLVNRALDNTL